MSATQPVHNSLEPSYSLVKNNCCNYSATSRNKNVQMCRILTLMSTSLIAAAVFASILMTGAIEVATELSDVQVRVHIAYEYGDLLHALQIERADLILAIRTNNTGSVTEAENNTDSIAININIWPVCGYISSTNFIEVLNGHRNAVDANNASIAAHREVLFYGHINHCFIEELLSQLNHVLHESLWQYMLSYMMLIRTKENTGIVVSLGIMFFEHGILETEDYTLLRKHDMMAWDHLATSRRYSQHASRLYDQYNKSHRKVFDQMANYSTMWSTNSFAEHSPLVGKAFHDTIVEYITLLRSLCLDLKKDIKYIIMKDVDDANFSMMLCILCFIMLLVTTPILIFMTYKMTSAIHLFALGATMMSYELNAEKERADNLLFRMMPKHIAQQLKTEGQATTESFDIVTIAFSDIVGFTAMTAVQSPLQVVEFLNTLYQFIDYCADHYDVYKVETIGDAYMVVSGLPKRNGMRHVTEIALMATEILGSIKDFRVSFLDIKEFEMRIGIHSGPVVAGVVGTKMPRYCLFGDTVNTASRMESYGAPNRIHISKDTKTYLEQTGGFTFEPRGCIPIKGKGIMETFWITGTTHCSRHGGFPCIPRINNSAVQL